LSGQEDDHIVNSGALDQSPYGMCLAIAGSSLSGQEDDHIVNSGALDQGPYGMCLVHRRK